MEASKKYLKSNDFPVEKAGYITDADRHAETSDYQRGNPPQSGNSPDPLQSNNPLLSDSTTNSGA